MDFGKWLQQQGKTAPPEHTQWVSVETPTEEDTGPYLTVQYPQGVSPQPPADLPPDFDDRIGMFTIDHDVLKPKEIMAIMAKCVILSAKYRVHDGVTQYVAKSPLFAVSPKGAYMREYNFELAHDPAGTIRVIEAY